jgi:probable phosphoglycerate mutase
MSPRPTDSLFGDLPAETRARRPEPPKGPWVHAHCDGGARGNPGPSGYGAVLADDHGNILAELSEYLGLRTNNFAEYSGLLGCLAWALKHEHPRLRVVSDSELMVKQIQGKYQVKSPDLKPLYDVAKRRIAQLEAFEITHALRHKNKEADRLANEAMDRGTKRPLAAAPVRNGPPSPATILSSPAQAPPKEALSSFRDLVGPAFAEAPPTTKPNTMLRGFTRDGVVHILGSTSLPDNIFVKIIPE